MGIPERKKRERELRRAQILDAARALLLSKGYFNTSVQDISERAEISVGTIYLYFKNKEEIYATIHEEGMMLLFEIITATVKRGGDPEEKLRSVGVAYGQFSRDNRIHFNAFSYILAFPEIMFSEEDRLAQGKHGMALLNTVADIIEEGIASGAFKKVDAKRYAILMWSTLHGLLQVRKISDLLYHDYDFDELYRYNLDYLIDSLKQ